MTTITTMLESELPKTQGAYRLYYRAPGGQWLHASVDTDASERTVVDDVESWLDANAIKPDSIRATRGTLDKLGTETIDGILSPDMITVHVVRYTKLHRH